MAVLAGVPERPKGAGCKPAGSAYEGSNPSPCIVQPSWRESAPALLRQTFTSYVRPGSQREASSARTARRATSGSGCRPLMMSAYRIDSRSRT